MTTRNLQGRPMHQRSLELAAAAIDVDLTVAERHDLEAHLAGCPTCVRRAAAMRTDATRLGRPIPDLPSSRVDDAVYQEIARRRARPGRMIVLAAAAILLAALMSALAIGAYLQREPQRLQTTVLPVPSDGPVATQATPSAVPTELATATARPDPTLLPSGSLPLDAQVVFNLGGGQTRPSIATATIGGAPVREIALGQNASFLPDADQLVFECTDQSNNLDIVGICLARLTASGVSRLVDDPTARLPRWEPAGNRGRFTYNVGMIDVGEAWIADKDGSSPRRLAEGGAPAWSADGLWLCYQPAGATFQVAIIRPDGSGSRLVGSGYDPAWGPTGARLAYARVDGSTGSIVIVSAAAAPGAESVAFATESPLHHPVWLFENLVAFWMDGDVWLIDLRSSDAPTRLTTGLAVADGAELSVTQDGAWLMFSSPELAGGKIHVVSAKGGWALAAIDAGPASRPIWRPVP